MFRSIGSSYLKFHNPKILGETLIELFLVIRELSFGSLFSYFFWFDIFGQTSLSWLEINRGPG